MRFLVVHDPSVDFQQIVQLLQAEFAGVDIVDAASRATLEQAVDTGDTDLVLVGLPLAWAAGQQVLQQVRERLPRLPVLMVTPVAYEAAAIQAMRAGLDDYVFSEYLARLPLAVRACLARARQEREAEETIRELQILERRYRTITNQVVDMAYAFRVEPEGRIVSEWRGGGIQELTGYTAEELEARGGWTSLVHPDDWPLLNAYSPCLLAGESTTAEFRIVDRDGEVHWLHVEDQPEWDAAQGRVVRIYGGAKDITARRRAEEALQQTQDALAQANEELQQERAALQQERDLLQTIMENTTAHLAYLDRDFRLVQVNSTYVQASPYREDELIGHSLFELFPGVHDRAAFEYVRDTGARIERRLERYEGAREPLQGASYWDVTLVPVQDAAGQVQGLVLSAIDETENVRARQRTEQAARAAEHERALLETVLQNVPMGVAAAAVPSGQVFMANQMARDIWRQPARVVEAVNGYATYRGFHPDGRLYRAEEWPLARAVQTGETVLEERIEFERGDHSRGVMLVSAVPVYDAQGSRTAAVATFVDVTEREQLLSEVQRRAAELEATLASIADGVLLYDATGRTVRANDAAQQLAGFPESAQVLWYPQQVQELQVRMGEEQRRADPDELPAGRALHGETVHGEILSWQRRSDGRQIWVLASAAPICLPNGQLLGAMVTFSDVTRLRETQEELKRTSAVLQGETRQLEIQTAELQQERDLISALLDTAGALVVVLDREGHIVRFNRACERLTGYSFAEVQGRCLWDFLLLPAEVAPVRAVFESLRAGQFPSEYENYWVTRDGARRLVEWKNTALVNTAGQVGYVIATGIDITERRQAETEREQLLEQRGQLLQQQDQLLMQQRQLLAQSEALNRIHALLNSSLDVKTTFEQLLLEAAQCLGVEKAMLTQREEGYWMARHVFGLPAELIGPHFPDEQTELSMYMEKTRDVVVVDDIEQDPRFKSELIRRYTTGSLLVVPLLRRGQVTGAMFFSGRSAPTAFDELQVDFARKLATSIGLAQENASLYAASLRDAEMKAVLLREVNHRVKNNLSAIVGLLYIQEERPEVKTQPACQTLIRDLLSRVEGLSIVHGMLSAAQWSPLRLDKLVQQLIDSCLRALPAGRVQLTVYPSPLRVSANQAHALALIVSELAMNVAKYTVPSRETVRLTVEVTQEGENLVLLVHDDGPGYPEEVLAQQRVGGGLELVRNLVVGNLRGRLLLRNENGAVTEVRFPMQETATITEPAPETAE